MFTARIAFSGTEIRIAPSCPVLKDYMTDRAFAAIVVDNDLHLVDGDVSKSHVAPEKNAGEDTVYLFRNGLSGSDASRYGYFRIDEAEFTLTEDDTLVWHIPPVHTMPWPRLTNPHNPDLQVHIAKTCFETRLRSCLRYGLDLKEVCKSVPDKFRKILRPYWQQMLDDIRANAKEYA